MSGKAIQCSLNCRLARWISSGVNVVPLALFFAGKNLFFSAKSGFNPRFKVGLGSCCVDAPAWTGTNDAGLAR